MNAAACLVHQGVLSRHLLLTHLLNRKQIAIVMMAVGILLSALSIIYVTHTTRVMHAAYEHDQLEEHRLSVEQGQLLLERSTWMMQSRIQHLAETNLGMAVPENKSIVIVKE